MLGRNASGVVLSPVQATLVASLCLLVAGLFFLTMAADSPRLAALVKAPTGQASIDLVQDEWRVIYVRPGRLDTACSVTDSEGRPVPTRSFLGSVLPDRGGDRWVGLARFDASVTGTFHVDCSGPIAVAPAEQGWRSRLAPVALVYMFVIVPCLLVFDSRRRRLAKRAGRV